MLYYTSYTFIYYIFSKTVEAERTKTGQKDFAFLASAIYKAKGLKIR